METVIVTGATGFIGKALTTRLLKEGKKVYAIDVDLKRLKELEPCGNVITIEATFEEYHNLYNKIPDKIDVFYHFAWQGVWGEDYKDMMVQVKNIQYAMECVELAIQLECRKFISIGSSHQYLKSINSIDNEINTCSIYGAAKKASQILCKTLAHNRIGFNTVLFTNVYGVGDYSRRSTNIFISKILKHENLKLIEGENLHDWTYIDDAVEGLICIAEKGKNNKEYYVGSRKLKKFKEILIQVKETLDSEVELLFGEYNDKSYVDYEEIDLDALYIDTGFECKSDMREDILKTAGWVKRLDI